MIEIIKHTFGFCGEGHPSLLCMLGIGPIFLMFKSYVVVFWLGFKKTCSKYLYNLSRYTQKLF